MAYRNRRNNIKKTLKDYAVPLVAFFLILILAFSLFGGSDDTSTQPDTNIMENTLWASINFYNGSASAEIEYSWWDKKSIDDGALIYKWEKIIVKDWSVKIDFPYLASTHLDKNAILSYNEDNSLNLESSNLWLTANTDMEVFMTFAKVSVSEWSIANLYQNDLFSEISCVSWKVEVFNLAGESTILTGGQQLSIERKEASNSDLDLSILKTDFSDYFKASDWFTKNDGDIYLNSNSSEETSTGEVKKVVYSNLSSVLNFDNLTDESYISGNNIDITWTFWDEVTKITLNNTEATLDTENKTFKFKWVSLPNKENDLVFKAYNSTWEVLAKTVYTVYTTSWTSNSSTTTSSDFGKVLNFELDASKFVFTAPSTTGTYSTYDSRVTIYWSTPKWVVASVTVNGYKLWSFDGSSWRYHAWADYDNLKDGTNLYEIKYFDASGKLIYTNYFTIIKKSSNLPDATYSAEASVE